jgi:hypothetical protein
MAIKYKELRGSEGVSLYPFDDEKELYYRDVFAGFVPPGPKGGAIVVCGQEYAWKPPAPIYVLAEAQAGDSSDLIQKALDLKTGYKVGEFWGWLEKDFTHYLSIRNMKARERRSTEFYISSAPNSDTPRIAYHIYLTRNLLSPNKKLLHLGQSKALGAALQELPKSEIDSATAKDYPLLAALCYVVSAFEVNQPDYHGHEKPQFTNKDYDILNFNQDFNV